MEKDNLKLYVDLMNRYDEQAKIGMTLVFNEDEKHLMTYMKKIAMKDKEANKFLNSLTNMTPDERYLAVENLFNKKEGKKDIITINEVKDYKDEIASMSKQDQNKLNYIINNYNKLKVKGINLNDLTYIDENDEIKSVDLEEKVVPFKQEYEEEKTSEVLPLRSREDIAIRAKSNYEEMVKSLNPEPEKEKPVQKVKKAAVKDVKQKTAYVNALLLFFLTAVAGVILAGIVLFIMNR